jgi:hypothetical protein
MLCHYSSFCCSSQIRDFFYLNLQAMSQIIDVDSDQIAADVDFVTPPAEVKNQ